MLAAETASGGAHNAVEEAALIVVGATLIVLLQVFVRPWRQKLFHSEVVADSAIAGLATAYVFVVLLPELETGHEIIGDYIFLIVLAGFVTLYGLEHVAHRTGMPRGPKSRPRRCTGSGRACSGPPASSSCSPGPTRFTSGRRSSCSP